MTTKNRLTVAQASPLTTLHLTLGYASPRELADAIIQATATLPRSAAKAKVRKAKARQGVQKANRRSAR